MRYRNKQRGIAYGMVLLLVLQLFFCKVGVLQVNADTPDPEKVVNVYNVENGGLMQSPYVSKTGITIEYMLLQTPVTPDVDAIYRSVYVFDEGTHAYQLIAEQNGVVSMTAKVGTSYNAFQETFTAQAGQDTHYKVEYSLYDTVHSASIGATQTIEFELDQIAPNVDGALDVTENTLVKQDVQYTPILQDSTDWSADGYTVKVCGTRTYVEESADGNLTEKCMNIEESAINDGASNNGVAITLNETGAYEIYTEATDRAGNQAQSQTVRFQIDKDAPVPYISGVTDGACSKNDVQLDFVVKDFRPSLTDNVISVKKAGVLQAAGTYSWSAVANDAYSVSCEDVVFSQEGSYEVSLIGKDQAANETVANDAAKVSFTIDKTAPVFQIQGLQNGKIFYDSGLALNFQATDANHDIADYCITVKRIDENGDAQPDVTYKTTTGWSLNNGQATKTLTFDEDGNYTVSIEGKDKAGNAGEKVEAQFRIDTTAPDITLSAMDSYYNTTASVLVDIKELNYSEIAAEDMPVLAISKTLDGVASVVTDVLTLTGVQSHFQKDITEDGTYVAKVTAKDSSGGQDSKETTTFIVDQTKPLLSITGISNNQMSKEPVSITYVATDRNHDKEQYIAKITRETEEEQDSAEDTFTTAWAQNGNVISQTRTYETEGQYDISFDGCDKAGNVADTAAIHFCIDHTAPVISNIKYSDSNGSILEKYHNIYSNKAILVEFTIRDMVAGVNDGTVFVTVGDENAFATNRYLAHKAYGNNYYVYIPTDINVSDFNDYITIWASDYAGNETRLTTSRLVYSNQQPDISMHTDVDATKWTNQDVTVHTTVKDAISGIQTVRYFIDDECVKTISFDELVTEFAYDVTATKTAEKVSGYSVSVEVTNNSHTTNRMSKQIYIDKEKPIVELNGVKNGSHYKTSQTVIATVTDVSYNKTKTMYVVKRTLDGKTETMAMPVFHSNRTKDVNNHKYTKEGAYKIYAITTDGAGNKTTSKVKSFVIDKTAPKVAITGATNGSMNAGAVTLDFSCTDSFYKNCDVRIEYEKTLDGATTKGNVPEFTMKSKKSQKQHTFSEDGTYVVTMTAVDKAGNRASKQTLSFTIDQTKPDIRIVGTDNYQLWDSPVDVSFIVEESYYAGDQVRITGTRQDVNGEIEKLELPAFVNTSKTSMLNQTYETEGIYAFHVEGRDQAGNQQSADIHFTIDRSNPEIYGVKDVNGGYYQSFRLGDSVEEIFRDLTVVSYKMLLNGIEYNGTDLVEEEGKYALTIEAIDELKHKSTQNVEFMIDHTAPKVIFNGITDGAIVKEAGSFSLALLDEEDEILAIRVNGKACDVDMRTISYEEYGNYQVEVDCIDQAGNAVTRTLNFVYLNPVMTVVVASVAVIVVFGAIGWMFIRIRRKRVGGD